jgi:hypothetical protein
MAFDQNKPAANAPLASADVRNNFQHLKEAISQEHNWSDTDANAITHKVDVIEMTVTGSTQGTMGPTSNLTLESGMIPPVTAQHINIPASSGVAAGSYTLQDVIQRLVTKSHAHGYNTYTYNCDCNCSY